MPATARAAAIRESLGEDPTLKRFMTPPSALSETTRSFFGDATVPKSNRRSMESDSVFDERSSSINPLYEEKLISAKKSPRLLVGVVVVPGNAEANTRDAVGLHPGRPLAVHRLLPGDRTQVERQVGDVDPVATAHQARREQQADGRAVAHAGEIAQLGDDLAGLVNHHDLIRLIRADPDVVVLVEKQAVGAVDAVGEHDGFLGDVSDHGNAHDAVVTGIGDKQRAFIAVEVQSIRPERREAGR